MTPPRSLFAAFFFLVSITSSAAPLRIRERELRAQEHVEERLAPWAKRKGNELIVLATVGSAVGGKKEAPVTGGLFEVTTLEERPNAGKVRKFFHQFDRFSHQVHVVHVDEAGNADILETRSFAPQKNIGRWLGDNPLSKVVLAAFQTSEGLKTLVTTIVAVGAVILHPHDPTITGTAGGAVTHAFHAANNRLKQLGEAQVDAVDATASWIKNTERLAADGYPDIWGALTHYKDELQKNTPAPRPMTTLQFARKLTPYGL